MSDEVFLIPRDGVLMEDYETALEQLGATEHDPPQVGYLMEWSLGDTRVRLFEDAALHVEHLVVDGEGRDDVVARLRERLPTYAPEDMPALFDEIEDDDPDEFDQKLAILAAVAPKSADPALVALFHRGFEHEDPFVREQAAIVATVPAWPELRPYVERLANEDEDDRVRDTAATALHDIDKAAGKG
jgi:HEAT repeat protein